jgi:hypothetical protein
MIKLHFPGKSNSIFYLKLFSPIRENTDGEKLISNLLFISFYYIKKFRSEGKNSVYVFVLKNVFGNIKFVKTKRIGGEKKKLEFCRKKLQEKCPIISSFLISY